MTFKLASDIAYFFYRKNIIPENKLEEYVFGFEILLADLSILLIIGLLCVLVDKIAESIIFMLSFIILRRQTGGYHANSHINCNIIFISTYLIFLIILFELPYDLQFPIIICEIVVSLVLILLLAPIEHPNSPISRSKYNRCRKNSIITLTIQCTIAMFFIVINRSVAVSLATGMCSVAIYLLAQCIKNHAMSEF